VNRSNITMNRLYARLVVRPWLIHRFIEKFV